MTHPKRLAILVGGGPAPGINAVIGAATIRAVLEGVEVLGVEDGFEEARTLVRVNGEDAVTLEILKQSGQNTVAVAHAVKATTIDPARNGPWNPADIVLSRRPACFPCHRRDCAQHRGVLAQVPVAEVEQAGDPRGQAAGQPEQHGPESSRRRRRNGRCSARKHPASALLTRLHVRRR